jgi:hypothetical protein
LRLLGTVRFAPVSPILAVVPRIARRTLSSFALPSPLGFALDFTKLTDLRFGQPLGWHLQDFGSVLVDEIGRRTNPGKLNSRPNRCTRKRSCTGKDGLLGRSQQIGEFDPKQASEISQRRPTRHLPTRRPLPHRLLRGPEMLRDLLLPDSVHPHQAMEIVSEMRTVSRHCKAGRRRLGSPQAPG